MKKPVVMAGGIPWYRREDYARFLDIMEDARLLPLTYDQWRERAEAVERGLKGKGFSGVRAAVDPQEFPAWAKARGLNVDAKARELFASHAAREHADKGVKE